MAIYKPSNLTPNLSEIDFSMQNTFTCQVNTSGESIKAYKYKFLKNNTDQVIYQSNGINLTNYVKNKGTLTINNISNTLSSNLINGQDYLWGIRVYNDVIGNENQPNTKICSGYLVGSTKYVIWTNNNNKLEYNRYLEFNTIGNNNIMPILEPNEDNLIVPEEGEVFRQRIKIDWVEPNLGYNKDITKIECVDNFTYNYINGTPFSIYLCSDQHTYTSVYADPNDAIENSYYIVIYENQEDATAAHNAGETPATESPTITPTETARRIIGVSSETGEIRVQEPFNDIPVNGNAYLLFSYDRTTEQYTEVTSDVSQVIGGTAITDDSFVVITNLWSTDTKQLFIQPNINIKSDGTNPNEIVFDDALQRVDIIQTMNTTLVPGKTIDVTFEKLDNTQWLLKYVSGVNNITPPIIPGSTYTVYSDFIDSSPLSLIYARQTPSIILQYKNLNGVNDNYENISSTESVEWQDIAFQAIWTSLNQVNIKYYQYIIYDIYGNQIGESEEIYNNDLTWYFRGFQTGNNETTPNQYSVKIKIVDQYDKVFEQSNNFLVLYTTDEEIVPLNIKLDCENKAMRVEVNSPVYVISTDYENISTVTEDDLMMNQLDIPDNKVLNYTTVSNITQDPIIISPTFSYLIQFQLTSSFLNNIPITGSSTITEIAHKNNSGSIDYFDVNIYSFYGYYVQNEQIIKNENQFYIKIFKNGSTIPLMCFNNGTQDYFDISKNLINMQGLSFKILYALQNDDNYKVITVFPNSPQIDINYVLTQDIVYRGKSYYQGIYNYINGEWVANAGLEFVFLENLNQFQGASFESLEVPENCQDLSTGNLLWTDENNVWVDGGEQGVRTNINNVSNKWFMLYFTVDNSNNEEIVNCEIKINSVKI